MDDIRELKENLALASRILANEDLAQGWGHISVRVPGTDRFLIPPSMSPALVTPDDVLTFDLAGNRLEGDKPPNAETWLHTCIYRQRSDVGCVSHIHPPITITLGAAGQEIRPLHNFGSLFPDGVRLFTRPGLIDSEQLGTEVAAALGQNDALMLRGHGAIVVGANARHACIWSIYLEEAARIQLYATLLGSPQFYTREEASMIKGQIYLGPNSISIQRAWDYYVERLSKASAI
ncbi:MAG: class II aldolase/adducin family protein [Chloroflexi bacterium]|nr:class II aldolase/adducin family protein [Chloroflexota bacterium]